MIPGCAADPIRSRGRDGGERGPPPDLVVRGKVLELREQTAGVVAILQVEEVVRGSLYRPEVDCLLGDEWWETPVREGGRYAFRLGYRLGGVGRSFRTLESPVAISSAEMGEARDRGTPRESDPERLRLLLLRIQSAEISPEVEEELLRIGRPAVPTLLEALREGDEVAKWNAARLLALVPVSEAVPDLASLVEHPDEKVRLAAVYALREVRTGGARRALAAFLADSSPRVRGLAVDGLGRHREKSALEWVLPLLGDPVREVRRDAFRALGRIRGGEAARALSRALDGIEGARDLAAEALDALGRTGAPEATPALEAALTAGELGLSREGALALARLGPPGVPVLLRALESPDPYVRWRSVGALRTLTEERFGYRHGRPPEEQGGPIRGWRRWWKLNERQG